MKKDTVVSLKKPVEESDPLTALLRAGARQLLCEAVGSGVGGVSVTVPGRTGGRWSPVHGQERLFTGTDSDDGVGRGAYSGAEDAGPARPGSAFHLGLIAAVYQADGECGEGVAMVVFEGGIHG